MDFPSVSADPKILIGLGCMSSLSWFISTLSGGGSSLFLMPLVGLLLGTKSIAPVTTIGAILGNGDRVIAYRQNIDWKIIVWEAPGAFIGSCLGAFVLAKIRVDYLGILVGLFLAGSALNFFRNPNIDPKLNLFKVKVWYFFPAGLIYATLSGIIGSMGPLLVPLYLNFGLQKESLLGTQSAARMVIHLTKLIAYGIFGLLTTQHLIYGLLIGLAAIPGNWLGHLVLMKINDQQFRQMVMGFVLLGGLLMLWQNTAILHL